jgi:hypothetical protein
MGGKVGEVNQTFSDICFAGTVVANKGCGSSTELEFKVFI